MASNRQERLQMRQRGAGTRKIQAVDFGFSFGSPPSGNQAPPSIAQQLDSVAAGGADGAAPDRISPVTRSSRALRSSTGSRGSLGATTDQSPPSPTNAIATPGRNTEVSEGRSSKRRRISTREDVESTSISTSTSTPRRQGIFPDVRDDAQNEEQQTLVGERGTVSGMPTAALITDRDDVSSLNNAIEQEDFESPVSVATPPATAGTVELEAADNTQTTTLTRRKSLRTNQPDRDNPQSNDRSPETVQQRGTRTRGRKSLGKQPTTDPVPEVQSGPGSDDQAVESSVAKRASRRKRSPQSEQRRQTEVEDSERPTTARRGRGRRPRSAVERAEAEVQEVDTAERTRQKGKAREDRSEAARSSNDEMPEQGTSAQKLEDNRRNKNRRSLRKKQQTAPAASETTDARQTSPLPTKRRRGRARGQASRQQGEVEVDADADKEQERKRHEGTVAITVHRLANTHVLESTRTGMDMSEEEQDSTDELEAVGKTFPSRNGVNAADVLSQICKEILDKHLAALDNNITDETVSQSKRTEYARQRKTIEAYGGQLEGRLFELSEMLDSNFSLGIQLKKAKREALEMRKRLLEVRQQRHEVTLRMDAVRRQYSQEERAKTSRNAINHTLHQLDLMLDRSRLRTDDADEDRQASSSGALSGLEFLIRSVSDNVSSAVEGSYGGLLSQVRLFNAQLEQTAQRLEG